MKNAKLIVPMLAVALIGGAAAGMTGLASAATNTSTTATAQMGDHGPGGGMGRPAVMGTVSAVSGNTLTVADKDGTSYTVDVSSAKIMKGTTEGVAPTTVTAADIVVGDTVMVQGTTSGTTVTATDVMDGKFMGRGPGGRGGMGGGVMGTVSAISGTTLTVTNQAGGTYTVDASAATVRASGTTSSVSSIKVGDKIRVGGTVTTASMTAKDIEDGVPTPPTSSTTPTQ